MPPVTMSPREYLSPLTGLRLFAALCILVGHASTRVMSFSPNAMALQYISRPVLIGLPIFFILSGFVIHYNYSAFLGNKRKFPWKRFFLSRIFRLYPLYFFLLIIFFVADKFINHLPVDPSTSILIPIKLFCIQSWFFHNIGGFIPYTAFFTISWAVSTELFFYCIYPWTGRLVSGMHRPVAILAAILAVTGLAALGSYAVVSHWGQLDAWALAQQAPSAGTTRPSFTHWLINVSPYGRLAEFLVGCLLAQLHLQLLQRPLSPRETRWGVAATFTVALLLAVAILCFNPRSPWFGIAPGIAVLIFCLARYKGALQSVLAWRPFVVLGESSYAIYLTHVLFLRLFNRNGTVEHLLNGGYLVEWLFRMVVACSFCLLVGYAIYVILEKPMNTLLRQRYLT